MRPPALTRLVSSYKIGQKSPQFLILNYKLNWGKKKKEMRCFPLSENLQHDEGSLIFCQLKSIVNGRNELFVYQIINLRNWQI